MLERALVLRRVFLSSWLSSRILGVSCVPASVREVALQTAKPSPADQGDSTKTPKPRPNSRFGAIFWDLCCDCLTKLASRKSAVRQPRNAEAQTELDSAGLSQTQDFAIEKNSQPSAPIYDIVNPKP